MTVLATIDWIIILAYFSLIMGIAWWVIKQKNDTSDEDQIPVRVRYKALLTGHDEILAYIREANSAENCIGLIAWMHFFSPAKMWIAGLSNSRKRKIVVGHWQTENVQ